jgi:hypothetical protein
MRNLIIEQIQARLWWRREQSGRRVFSGSPGRVAALQGRSHWRQQANRRGSRGGLRRVHYRIEMVADCEKSDLDKPAGRLAAQAKSLPGRLYERYRAANT